MAQLPNHRCRHCLLPLLPPQIHHCPTSTVLSFTNVEFAAHHNLQDPPPAVVLGPHLPPYAWSFSKYTLATTKSGLSSFRELDWPNLGSTVRQRRRSSCVGCQCRTGTHIRCSGWQATTPRGLRTRRTRS